MNDTGNANRRLVGLLAGLAALLGSGWVLLRSAAPGRVELAPPAAPSARASVAEFAPAASAEPRAPLAVAGEAQTRAPRAGHEWAGTFLAGRAVCAASAAPLAARIVVHGAQGVLARTASTPGDGLFEVRLGAMRAAGLRLAIEAPGFERAEFELDAQGPAGGAPWPGEVRLVPAGGATIEARDLSGAGVAGARVLAWPRGEANSEGTLPVELGRTDADGSLPIPSAAFARFVVFEDSRVALVTGQDWPGPIPAVLHEGARLIVREGPEPGDAPAHGARISLEQRDFLAEPGTFGARLDAQGALPFALPPGDYLVQAEGRPILGLDETGVRKPRRYAHVTAQPGETLELVLGPAPAPWPLTAVEDRGGRPIEDFSAWIEDGASGREFGERGRIQGPIHTSSAGVLELSALVRASYTPAARVLAVTAPGRRVARLELPAGLTGTPIAVRLERAPEGWLRLLTHAGAPWREPVTLRQYPAGRVLLSGRAGPDGKFGPFPIDGEELVLREGEDLLGREIGRHKLTALARFGGTLTVRLSPRTARITVLPAPGRDAIPDDAQVFLLDEGGQWRAGRREGGRQVFEALNPGRYQVGPREVLAAVSEYALQSLPIVLADGQALELPFDPAWTPAPAGLQTVLLLGSPPPSELRLADAAGTLRPVPPVRVAAGHLEFALGPGFAGQHLVVLHPPSGDDFTWGRPLAEGRRGYPIVLDAGRLLVDVALADEGSELDPPPRLGPLARAFVTCRPRLAVAAAQPETFASAYDGMVLFTGPGRLDLGWFPAGDLALTLACQPNSGSAPSRTGPRSFVRRDLELTLGPGETRIVHVELELE